MSAEKSVSMRLATVDDAPVVHALLAELAGTAPAQIAFHSTIEDFEGALTGEHPAIHAYIAEQSGNAIGIAVFFLTYSTWYGSPGLYIQDLYVTEAARGQRLGEKLLEAASSWADERGATHLKLAVDTDNVRAQAFYERCGLKHRDDEMLYMIKDEAFRKMAGKS